MRTRTVLKTLLVSGALALASLATSNAFAEEINVGANIGNVPWEFQDASGKTVGFEIDLMTEVGKRLGMDVKFTNIPFAGLFAAVQSGQIDAAVSSITITKKRLESVSFAQPYYDSDQSLTVMAKSGLSKVEDLKGKVIGVVAATTGEAWANENAAALGIAEVRSYAAQQDLLLDVQNGRIEGGAGELAGFQYAITKIPTLAILVRIPTGERFAMMAKKDLPILQEINDAISAMKEDGTKAAIHEKWFGVAPDAGTSTVTSMPVPTAE